MGGKRIGTAIVGAGMALASLAGCNETTRNAAQVKLVQSVEEVNLSVISKAPLVVAIAARGSVANGGWSSPRLARGGEIGPDGILEVAFIADPPTSAVTTQTREQVAAADRYQKLPAKFVGVRVIAQANTLTKRMD